MKKLLILLAIVTLTACGGGGGGSGGASGGGSGGGGGSSNAPKLSASPLTLNFTSTLGESNPIPQNILARVSNTDKLKDSVFVNLVVPNDRFFDAGIEINGDQATVGVSVTTADSIGLGSHNSSLQILVCTDQACTKQIEGSPLTVQVNYTVNKPKINLNTSSINLSGKRGQQPDPVTISYLAGSIPFNSNANNIYDGITATIEYTSSETNWLAGSQDKGNLNYQLKVSRPVAAGVHTAKVTFASSENILIPSSTTITYTVSDNTIATDVDALSFDIRQTAASTSFKQSLTISAAQGSSFNWTASANQPWLTVTESGNTSSATTLQVSLNDEVAMLKNGVHQALISVSRDGSSDTYQIPVTLDLNTIQIDYAAPWFAYTGSPQKIHVFGENLDQLNGRTLYFNKQPITDFTVVSSGELLVQLPAMAATRYEVNTGADVDALTSKGRVTVINPEHFPATSIALASDAHHALYEPVTQQLIVDTGSALGIKIYRLVEGVWQLQTIDIPMPLYMPSSLSYSLTPDGRELLVGHYGGSSNMSVWAIDMETLKARELFKLSYNFASLLTVLALSDEKILVQEGYWKNLLEIHNRRTGQVQSIDVSKLQPADFFRHTVEVKADAARSYVEIGLGGMNNESSLGIFNRDDHNILLAAHESARQISADGSKLATWGGNRIYDTRHNLLGDLGEGYFINVWFSNLGEYAYALLPDGNFIRYDLRVAPVDGHFSGETLFTYYDNPNVSHLNLLSPSGNTGFAIDGTTLHIIPLQ